MTTLKRSLGKPVKTLVDDLGMSYMGIRQHLDSMEKQKLVEGMRRARKVGRPEKVYRLTERGQSVFERKDSQLLAVFLEEAAGLFDGHAPEKLLLHHFLRMGERYAREVAATSTLERVGMLAELRNRDGYFAASVFDNERGLRMEEYHHPLGSLQKRFPTMLRHEQTMIERVLGSPVTRREKLAGTHRRVSWEVPTVS